MQLGTRDGTCVCRWPTLALENLIEVPGVTNKDKLATIAKVVLDVYHLATTMRLASGEKLVSKF